MKAKAALKHIFAHYFKHGTEAKGMKFDDKNKKEINNVWDAYEAELRESIKAEILDEVKVQVNGALNKFAEEQAKATA